MTRVWAKKKLIFQLSKDGDHIELETLLASVSEEKRREIVNGKDEQGYPPLRHAVRNNHFDVVRILLQYGAS